MKDIQLELSIELPSKKPILEVLRPIQRQSLLVVNGETYTHEIDFEAMKILAWHNKNIPANES